MTLAPDCGLAVALAGWCHAKRVTAWNSAYAEERTKASQMADRAGILAPADPMVLAIRASIAHLAGSMTPLRSLAARAVATDPTCAWGWDRLGWVHEATNRPDDATAVLRTRRTHPCALSGRSGKSGWRGYRALLRRPLRRGGENPEIAALAAAGRYRSAWQAGGQLRAVWREGRSAGRTDDIAPHSARWSFG